MPQAPERPYNPLVRGPQNVQRPQPQTQAVLESSPVEKVNPDTPHTSGSLPTISFGASFNVSRPAERIADIIVPSKGLLYGGVMPDGVMRIRAMTIKDRKLMVGFRGDGPALINLLMQRMVVDCKVPFDQFLIQDRLYFLMMLRMHSYGDTMEFKITCPNCKEAFDKVFSFSKDLKINYLSDATVEPYSVELPVSKVPLQLRYLRAKDEVDILNYAASKAAKAQAGDVSYTYRIVKHIHSINNVPVTAGNLSDALGWIESLETADGDAISKAVNERDFGPEFNTEVNCQACRNEFAVELPWIDEFFRAIGRGI